MSEEELEELERELEETLGDFDEEIEREKTYAEERANGVGGEDGLGGAVAFEEYDEEEDGGSSGRKNPPTPSSESGEGSQKGGSASSPGGGGQGAEATEQREGSNSNDEAPEGEESDRPDLEDLRKNDDIVARQMRELAESETDPELKKKYWEDYYKYRGSQ